MSKLSTLLIRHLPTSWSKGDVEKFFGHLSSCDVLSYDSKKHIAVVDFPSEASARSAMSALHQLAVGSRRLVVEFSRAQNPPRDLPDTEPAAASPPEPSGLAAALKRWQSHLRALHGGLGVKWGLTYPHGAGLRYFYPPPSPSVLRNIVVALSANPKLYTQVLHLMNKLHLPCPFDTDFPVPDTLRQLFTEVERRRTDIDDTEESELSSPEDASRTDTSSKRSTTARPGRKRRTASIHVSASKRVRASHEPQPCSAAAPLPVAAVFEAAVTPTSKHIDIRIPGDQPQANLEAIPLPVATGFGRLEPTSRPNEAAAEEDEAEAAAEAEEEEEAKCPERCLTAQELEAGRMSKEQLSKLAAFKRHEPGDPSQRLYVKNLAKTTSEADLKAVFGSFVVWSDPYERSTFHVQLYTSGRLKGQAFVTFASEEAAGRALRSTHGFVLNEKPMAVQFARGARAKPDEKSLDD